jgi:hypothetical protein
VSLVARISCCIVLAGCAAARDVRPEEQQCGGVGPEPLDAEATSGQDETAAIDPAAPCGDVVPGIEQMREALARAEYEAGVAEFEAGAFEIAADRFCRSYRLSERPELLWNVARSWERAGDPRRAAAFYESFADRAESAPEAARVAARVRADQLRQ